MRPISELLPKYGYIEANNLKGLQPGFVVAQMDVAANAKAALLKDGMMENGTICAISKAGIIAPTADSKALFICFSEPLNTVLNSDQFFAVDVEHECPRLVQLIPGDEWTASKALDLTGALNGRIEEITEGSAWYKTGMANGDEGHHYIFIG